MKNAVILIDKAGGLSSAAELSRLKRKLSLNKVGHAGTLDPMATGLLVCLCNSATRLASYAQRGKKLYSGIIKLGVVTTTDDKNGVVISESDFVPDYNEVLQAKSSLIGKIEQMPPDISAKKIDGQRAYKISRKGLKPKLKTKQVFVDSFETWQVSPSEIGFRVECSSGTYIRSLARDLGVLLGCGGCLYDLRRERSYPFSVKSAKSVEDICESDFLDWTALFPDHARVKFESTYIKKMRSGDMKNIRSSLGGIIAEQVESLSDTVLYFDDIQEQPMGILKNVSGVWEIAVNLN